MQKHLGKLLVAFTLAPLCVMANEVGGSSGNASGLFVGVDLGLTSTFVDQKILQETSSSGATPSFMNVGIKLGYNYYFMDFLGARAYLDYSYGFNLINERDKTSNTSTLNTLNSVAFNIDLLANLYKTDSITFGAFVGIGLGYATMGQTLKNVPDTQGQGGTLNGSSTVADGFILPINIGLNITANNHHRFEFGIKVPAIGIENPDLRKANNNNISVPIRNMITTMGYSYIF